MPSSDIRNSISNIVSWIKGFNLYAGRGVIVEKAGVNGYVISTPLTLQDDIGGGKSSVLCRVTGGSGNLYNVDLYANGFYKDSTGQAELYVLDIACGEQIPADSWIIGNYCSMKVLGSGNTE